ncbi:integrase [Streptomyces microflavus]|uniref:integrase n=1 Tax=Streptomyces TaxID=1883 RepID=UPI00131A5BAB|nr:MULTISPECIES: integrase [Streptomyces]MDX2977372.1 integrase [Streptomyces sp. NRRL_B-2249]
MWGLADKPRSIKQHELTWNFFKIVNPKWRVVAKEILVALLAPQHDRVLECALALRKNRSPRTCNRFLRQFTAWFNWLTANGVASLAEVTQEHCDRFAAEAQWYIPKPGAAPVQAEPETLAESVRVVQLITLYGDLLSTDSYRAGFVPWDGRSTIKVVGGTWLRANRTPSVPDHLLQPVLATCLYLVNTVGPHLADLVEKVREDAAVAKDFPRGTLAHVPDLKRLIAQMRADRVPLPQADGRADSLRISTGDLAPLKDLAWYRLAYQVGTSTIAGDYLREKIAPELLALAEDVGFENYWARTAPKIAREEDGALVPWTAPLSDAGVRSMVANVLAACLVVTSALSGMRNSELLELSVGCRRQTQTESGGTRYRLAGRLIKGQKLGGVPDEWVVIEDVHRAVALAERLLGAPRGAALFNTVALSFSLDRMRKWLEESGNRERWGLPVIPAGPISARMLRRTLALSIAARPGGLLAAKIALKHISVATTEGYAAHPGGSQRLFLTEVEEAEQEKHMELTVEAFRDLKEGRKPAGPGARGLIEALQHVDAQLNEAARNDPKVLEDDRHLENLLSKLSKVLHVGAANFCWFRDPSKALCLKLAGTPNAKKPLVGMCDSARCPQATHHRSHRPVWLGQVTVIDTFVESPRVAKGEKNRLLPERDRALRVVAEIDAASPAA